MAALTILSAVLPVILEKVISPAMKQLFVAFGKVDDLEKLERILTTIQSVIVDAEEREINNISIHAWLSSLKNLSYEAEDVLEEFEFEDQRKQRRHNPDNNMRRKALYCYSKILPSMAQFKLCWRLNAIIKKIEKIADEINKFNFQLNKVPQISNARPQTHSYVDTKKIIGREKDKDDIVSFLINHDANNMKDIAVLPIVAMGGMGKTTLSKLVYNDSRVEHHFQLRMWVCVSDADFDVARLVGLIVDAATKEERNHSNLELLQQRLREIISGKRYLIVLDDVWNENRNQWEDLKTLLDCGGKGSTVVVSTRSEKAANMMATTPFIHFLKELPEEDSWELFRKRAFAEGEEEPERLVKIGKDIINHCGGLPLAINTLGSMMRDENDEEKWKAVLDSDMWKSVQDQILPALRLSYNYLPPHLKECFAFCAIYPKGYVMEKETLIQLWMANGYIPSERKEDLDIKGKDIFDRLVWRSFFQNVEEDINYEYGVIITCKMHDLMHDLARSIMRTECLNFAYTPEWENISSTARHLLMPSLPKSSCSRNNLAVRTIVMLEKYLKLPEFQIRSILRLKSLRVLSLSIMDSVISVTHLKHLRWLDLSSSNIMKLPEGICFLYNLQTLKLSNCKKIKELPDNLTDLVNLRHLYIDGCNDLTRMPRGMRCLKHLHTLTMYVVSSEADRGLQELNNLNLYGTLELCHIKNVSNAIDAQHANLLSKKNLHYLTLSFDGGDSIEVFEALKPHDELKLLEVTKYRGKQFPKWLNVLHHLTNLVQISLCHLEKCKELPPLWQLPFLERLHLSYVNKVKHIINKTTCCDGDLDTKIFPSLKELSIFQMKNLESLPQGMESLTQLFISYCDRLTSLPEHLTKLEKLALDHCNFIESLPQGMGSLRNISSWECNRLMSLPEDLTELYNLHLFNCNALKSLPQEMKNLSSLCILHCKGITLLPEAFHVQFPSLASLTIIGDDELIRPFQFGGDYWHLIENIPKKDIRLDEHCHESSTSREVSRIQR